MERLLGRVNIFWKAWKVITSRKVIPSFIRIYGLTRRPTFWLKIDRNQSNFYAFYIKGELIAPGTGQSLSWSWLFCNMCDWFDGKLDVAHGDRASKTEQNHLFTYSISCIHAVLFAKYMHKKESFLGRKQFIFCSASTTMQSWSGGSPWFSYILCKYVLLYKMV